MTNKALQKLLTTNCDKIADLVVQMHDALEDFGDEEVTYITTQWLNLIDQCISVELPGDEVENTLVDTIDYLNEIAE